MILRRLAKDSAVYGSADLITKLFTFVAFPILARSLTPNAFGTLDLITTVTALLGLAVNCGLNNSVQRFYWDNATTSSIQPTIISSGLVAQVLFGITAFIIGSISILLLAPVIPSRGQPITWIGLVAALLIMALSQWSQYILDVLRLHFSPWHFFILALLSRVASISFGIFAVVSLGLGIDGLLIAQASVLILMLPLALYFIRKDLSMRSVNLSWLTRLVKFGYPFIFSGLAYWLFGTIDRWMLAAMTSVNEVGIYAVSFRSASIVLFVSTAFGQAWSPIAIKIRTDYPVKYRIIYGDILLLLLYVMLVIGSSIALFSGEVIGLVLTKQYYLSALPLSILCFGIVLQSTQQVTAIGISLEKQTRLFARLAWVTALINLLANWYLIPRFGAAGAAWGTLIAYAALTTGYLYYTQCMHPMSIAWNKLLALLLMGTAVAIVSVTCVSYVIDLKSLIFKLTSLAFLISIGLSIIASLPSRKLAQ